MKNNSELIHDVQKEKPQKKIADRIVLFIIFFIISASIITITIICSTYERDKKKNEIIKQDVLQYEDSQKEFSVDFDYLKGINTDVVAWIRFDNPAIISYPVLRGINNSQYLHHDLNKNYNVNGSIFEDMNNASDFTDLNTIVYGHNMLDGSMFGSLQQYKDPSFWEDNQYFYIYTPDKIKHTYHVYAAYIVSPNSDIYTYKFGNDQLYQDYLNKYDKKKLYETNLKATTSDHIITLSTCTFHGKKRMVLQAIETEKKQL